MRSAVHFSLAALLALPAIGCAQEKHAQNENKAGTRRAAQQDESPAEQARRLESVTWNSVKHEITWMISSGAKSESRLFRPSGSENYEINLDDATMTYSGETRRFSREEASNVHVLMDLIAKYAVDSTVWWEDGQGEPVDGKEPKAKPKEERAPAKPADDDDVAVLRVAYRPPAAADRQALHLEIQRLEKRLAELKRLEQAVTAAELARN